MGAWGIQTGQFAASWANFIPQIDQLLRLYTGEANSYYLREGKAEKEKMEISQPECGTGF